jgi:hypothetical protein
VPLPFTPPIFPGHVSPCRMGPEEQPCRFHSPSPEWRPPLRHLAPLHRQLLLQHLRSPRGLQHTSRRRCRFPANHRFPLVLLPGSLRSLRTRPSISRILCTTFFLRVATSTFYLYSKHCLSSFCGESRHLSARRQVAAEKHWHSVMSRHSPRLPRCLRLACLSSRYIRH